MVLSGVPDAVCRFRVCFPHTAARLVHVTTAISCPLQKNDPQERDPRAELIKAASESLPGMLEAMVGVGEKPRARGLHPTEHNQLSAMISSWRERGVLPPSPLYDLDQRLAALKLSAADATAAKTGKKRAAWIVAPTAPKPDGSTTIGVGLSPQGSAGRGADPSGPRTDDDRKASLDAALKELFARNVKTPGGWWGSAFEGRGPFREGPEGHWSLHLLRARDNTQQRLKQGRGLLGVNGDHGGGGGGAGVAGDTASVQGAWAAGTKGPAGAARGLGDNGVKMEVDEADSDGTPSTPSTVPSEASPSSMRDSPVPEPAAPEVGKEQPVSNPVDENGALDVKPVAVPVVVAAQRPRQSPGAAVGRSRDGRETDSKSRKTDSKSQNSKSREPDSKSRETDSKAARRSPSPRKQVLSKREAEAEERQRRKEEVRRAGKEIGRLRGLERERLRKEKEVQRERLMAEARERKEAAAKAEIDAKEAEEAMRQKRSEELEIQREKEREREREREHDRLGKVLEGKDDEEERRRGRGKSREQERPRERERWDREMDGTAGRQMERAAAAGRDREDSRRHHALGEDRSLVEKEERGRGKEVDRAGAGGRDKDDSRRHNDVGGSRDRPRGKGHLDLHDSIEDRGKDGWRKHGSRERPDLADGGRRKLDSRERDLEVAERKRRRTDPDVDWDRERHGEYTGEEDRPNKKKNKKDKKDRKDKRRDRRSEPLRVRAGSEDSRGRKRSRDFDGVDHAPSEEVDSRTRAGSKDYAAMQVDPPRRGTENLRQRSGSDLGPSGSERRDVPRPAAGLSGQDSDLEQRAAAGAGESRRGGRMDGSEKRARRAADTGAGAGPDAIALDRAGGSRERHSRLRREPASVSGGGGLPGMDVYGSGASPSADLDVGGHGRSSSGRMDHHRGGGPKKVDAYGHGLSGREASPDDRRKKEAAKDGSRPRLAAMTAYGSGMEDEGRGGSRSERDGGEKDYARAAAVDKNVREPSGRRGEAGSRLSSSSNVRI